jgi:hypothetical protein
MNTIQKRNSSAGARREWKRCAAVLAMIAVSSVPPARGTTLARMSLAQLASAAQIVARVRCTGGFSRRDAGSIWTFTDFTVEEIFKGAPGTQIEIRLPGGRDGHLVETVEGAPRFAAGDEAILFLERTSAGDWSISAWAAGTFRIEGDWRSGEQTITQDSSAGEVFDLATRTFRADGIARMPLAQFRARLAAAIADGGK